MLPESGADQGGPGLPLPAGLDDEQAPSDPLGCLKDVIDDFPKLLTELQDPKDVQDAVKALQILAGIQTRLMSAAPGQQQGGPGAAPPSY